MNLLVCIDPEVSISINDFKKIQREISKNKMLVLISMTVIHGGDCTYVHGQILHVQGV